MHEVEWYNYRLELLSKFIISSNSRSKVNLNNFLKLITWGDKNGNLNINVIQDVLCKRFARLSRSKTMLYYVMLLIMNVLLLPTIGITLA
jgi:hypothetical protein